MKYLRNIMTMYTPIFRTFKISVITIIVTLGISVGKTASAQSLEFAEIRTQLDSIFSDLNLNMVPTGILLDYGIDLVDFSCYDGSSGSEIYYSDFETFNSLVAGIHSSSIRNPKPIPQPNQVRFEMYDDLTASVIPVGVIAFKYAKIIENADSLGLIVNTGTKLLDKFVNGRWCDPYVLSDVFGMSPVKNSFNSRNVTYKFSQSYFFANLDIEIMEFDPGDGYGFRPFSSSGTMNVSYVEDGYHDIFMKLILVDGTELNARSYINILSSPSSQGEFGTDPTEPQPVPFASTYNETVVRADVTIYNRPGHTDIKKPFIYVEGFNISKPDDISINIDDVLEMNTEAKYFHDDFKNTDLFRNYDVIYIDWKNPNERIEANATLLKDIITAINLLKDEDAERNIIMGESMGGLICRYALCTMESLGVDHQTKIYVSHDSPHLGANLPISLQYLYHNLHAMVYNIKNAVNFTLDLFDIEGVWDWIRLIDHNLHSASVRQMVVNYLDENGVISNSMHEEFMQNLRGIGFPRGTDEYPIINLAISNGDINPINRQEYYLDIDCNISLKNLVRKLERDELETDIFNRIIGKRNLYVDIEARPHVQTSQVVSKILLQYKKKGIIDCNETIYSSIRYVSGPYPVDASSGSVYSIPIAFNNIDTLRSYGCSINAFEIKDKFLFVPSHSSLCIGGGAADINETIYLQDYRSLGEGIDTPFDCVYNSNSMYSNEHIELTSDMIDWVLSFEDYSIVGPTNANDGDRFVLTGYEGNPQWSCENAFYIDAPAVFTPVASISENGVLSINQYGHINVTASFTNEFGNTITLTKPVICGTPPFTLSASETNSPALQTCSWRIKASHSDSRYRKFQSQLGAQYQWKEYVSDEWETRDSIINVTFLQTELAKNIYFRLKTNNAISPTYSVTVQNRYYSPLPFVPELPPIVINDNGELSMYGSSENIGNMPATKSEDSASMVIKCCGAEISVRNCKSSSDILEALLESDRFVETLHILKPWGEKEMLMIPMEWCYGNGEHICAKQLKIIYKNW